MADVPRTADVVVVGGGVHGASVAYHLARRGAGRVVLAERKFLASGPTGRSSALVRRFYAMPLLTRTANGSADVYRHWAERVGGGDPGFRQVGILWLVGSDRAENLRANVQRARQLGANVRVVERAEIQALVPAIAVDDVALGAYEPESGYADAGMTTNALATRAGELGATVAQYVTVEAIATAGDKITGVRTDAGEIHAPAVVVCAGLWAGRLLGPLGIDVPVAPTRHQMCFFRRPPDFANHPAILDRPHGTYMRPETGNLTIHGFFAYDEVVDPDHEPVLGAVPEHPGLYVNFGWSGHGFKHAPAIGDILAQVVLDGHASEWDLAPFRWSRFRDHALIPRATAADPPH